MKNIEGKTAFITGGASGIGFGMARAFLQGGMKVVIADLAQDRLDEAAAVLAATNHRDVHFLRVDVSDRNAMARAADEAEQVFGKVHVVCNNAGVGVNVAIDQAAYEDWDWVFGTNVQGVINGVVSFIPKLKAHGEGGHIVNTSSMAGLIPLTAPGGIYSASKFAVRGITESLRLALAAQNIGVSCLCPGLTRSRLMEAESLRPDGFRAATPAQPRNADAPSPANSGMDPLELGERVLQGIRDNDAFILPHGEFKDEVADLFAEIVAGFPDGQDIDPGRLAFEDGRRRATAEAKAAIKRN